MPKGPTLNYIRIRSTKIEVEVGWWLVGWWFFPSLDFWSKGGTGPIRDWPLSVKSVFRTVYQLSSGAVLVG